MNFSYPEARWGEAGTVGKVAVAVVSSCGCGGEAVAVGSIESGISSGPRAIRPAKLLRTGAAEPVSVESVARVTIDWFEVSVLLSHDQASAVKSAL